MRELIACVFLAVGLIFITASAVGVLRLPDFYTRLHASGMGETLGLVLSFIGLVIIEGATLTSVKMIMVALLVFLANPIGTHMLVRAARKAGLQDWRKPKEEE